VFGPPISTLRAGLRACCVNCRGAVGKAHARALDIGAGLTEQIECFLVLEEIDADFLEDGVGVVFDGLEAFRPHDLVIGHVARDVRHGRGRAGGTRGALGVPATTAAA
jgi:hypothetical protein